jgi:hypothetical protein
MVGAMRLKFLVNASLFDLRSREGGVGGADFLGRARDGSYLRGSATTTRHTVRYKMSEERFSVQSNQRSLLVFFRSRGISIYPVCP